jgi:hypothetical protein
MPPNRAARGGRDLARPTLRDPAVMEQLEGRIKELQDEAS